MPNQGERKVIEIVSATRLPESEFWTQSALGISLSMTRSNWSGRATTCIAYENRAGLPELYNARIAAKNEHDILVFVHDDVWIDDLSFCDRVIEGCDAFDVIGLAGCARTRPNQAGWMISDLAPADNSFWIHKDIVPSGCVAHGPGPVGERSYFGPMPLECELLDGLFFAMKKKVVLDSGARFDPQFKFHFYDLDFCRTARLHRLRLGTWPILVTHQSHGAYGSKNWIEQLAVYRAKWAA
jgi:protein O-GlcNAc transferase